MGSDVACRIRKQVGGLRGGHAADIGLVTAGREELARHELVGQIRRQRQKNPLALVADADRALALCRHHSPGYPIVDRKSVVWGKSVYVRVDLGVRRNS